MDSIGNDIVTLGAVNVNRTITPNFYNKILAGSELPLHQSNCPGIPFYQYVWLAWSVKEAAYKCLKRTRPDLVFSPVSTVITAIEPPTASADLIPAGIHQTGISNKTCYQIKVNINSRTLYARSVIYADELIHSIASLGPDLSAVMWGLDKIPAVDPASQSIAVRSFLKRQFSGEVFKNDVGVPSLNISGDHLPVSFSHHEQWVGYALGKCLPIATADHR